ncbi:MAG: T9SS type A sorting domain-containing protein [candidate division Zixibacteria bacterium]|nr:T9SS type A sorting domain-containing protein [candidate division Zixibacteria bacterium]
MITKSRGVVTIPLLSSISIIRVLVLLPAVVLLSFSISYSDENLQEKGKLLPAPSNKEAIYALESRYSEVSTIFYDDFENGGTNWSTIGFWQIGEPTSGPETGYYSPNCAGTNLHGDYMNYAYDLLISKTIAIPECTSDSNKIILRFREWTAIESGYDHGWLRISTDMGGSWSRILGRTGYSGWRQSFADITSYENDTIQVMFQLISDDSLTFDGWFIDDVEIIELAPLPLWTEIGNINERDHFIYLTVDVDTFGVGFSDMETSNFTVFEDGRIQTWYLNIDPPISSEGGTKRTDIVFLMDNSGSMEEEQEAIQENIIAFIDSLQSNAIDFALGLCRFGQSMGNGYPIIEDNGILTTDVEYFRDDVWNRNVLDGGSERGWSAIYESARGFAFRPGSNRQFILITDQGSESGHTFDEALQMLHSGSITFNAIVDTSDTQQVEDYCHLADATGGYCYHCYSDFSYILRAISQFVSSSYVISYRSDTPIYDNRERLVEVEVAYGGDTFRSQQSYLPGLSPVVNRTASTLAIHEQAWPELTEFIIEIEATDYVSPEIHDAKIFYRTTNTTYYNSSSMTNTSADTFSASIPVNLVRSPGVDYFITVSDSLSLTSDPSLNPRSYPYQIAVLPNQAPFVEHTPPTSMIPGESVVIDAIISDNTNYLTSADLYYRKIGQLTFRHTELTNTSGSNFTAQIPPEDVTDHGIQYYIYAKDDHNIGSYYGTPDIPHQLTADSFSTHLYFLTDPIYLLPHNYGVSTQASLMIRGARDVVGIQAELLFDPNKLMVVGIQPGEFLEYNGGIVSDFSTYQNEAGTVSIRMTTQGGIPVGVDGDGEIALIKFLSKVTDVSSDLQVTDASLRDHRNETIHTEFSDGRFESVYELLADFDFDCDIDFADFTAFVSYWNEQPDNLTGDIAGPITGDNPGLGPWPRDRYPYPADGVIDFEDQMIFIMMYNWYYLNSPDSLVRMFRLDTPTRQMSEMLNITVPEIVEVGERFLLAINLPKMNGVYGLTLGISYDNDLLSFVDYNLESTAGEGDFILSLDRHEEGFININRAVAGGYSGMNWEDNSAIINFKAEQEGTVLLRIDKIDMRDRYNSSIIDYSEYLPWERFIEIKPELPAEIQLLQSYPNPFNSEVNIEFALPHKSQVKLSLFNLLGRKVATLVDEELDAGYHIKNWNAEGFASGIYFYKLQTGTISFVKRMTLLK